MEVSKFIIDGNDVYVKDAEGRNLIAGLSDDITTAQNTADNAQNGAQAAQETANQAVNGLASKQDTITGAYYTGNIDDLTTTSMVWCVATNVTGTLPFTTGYFMIETFKGYNFKQYVQKAYKYDSAGIPSVAFRMYANNRWSPWRSITLS